jgi:hypothetical protein
MHRTDASSQHPGAALGALGDTVLGEALAVLGGAGVSVAAPVLASVGAGVCAGVGAGVLVWLGRLGSKAPIARSASPSTTHAAAMRTIVLVWSGTLAVCSIGVSFFGITLAFF